MLTKTPTILLYVPFLRNDLKEEVMDAVEDLGYHQVRWVMSYPFILCHYLI